MQTKMIDHGQIGRLFHALSDETRLRIVEMLSRGERCVCDLTDALDAAQSRLSYHLKTLKDAGLIRGRRQGRWMYYALEPGALETMTGFLDDVRPTAMEGWGGDGACGPGCECCG